MNTINENKQEILSKKAQLLEEKEKNRFWQSQFEKNSYYNLDEDEDKDEDIPWDYEKELELFKNRNRYVMDIFNKVEFIGSDEQIKQINSILNRKSIEGNNANCIDLYHEIKIPDELNIECQPIGLLTYYLLFGNENGIGIISRDEARLRFEMYDRIEQEKGFDLALNYYCNLKKYGHISKHSWCEKNWNSALKSIDSFRSYREECMSYSTEGVGIPYMIEELSKTFPEVQFNCVWGNISQTGTAFKNGKLLNPYRGNYSSTADKPTNVGSIESYYRINNFKYMQDDVYNTLGIIGSDDQIKEVKDFIKGDPWGTGQDTLIDFNKIIKKPEELISYYDIDLRGKLMHCLLFGDTSRIAYNSNSDELMQSIFKCFTNDEKQNAFKLALDFQSMIEKYGSSDSNEWCLGNWGTEWNAGAQELISDNTISFFTEKYSCKKVLFRLSELFPEVTFDYQCIYCYNHEPWFRFRKCFAIRNGESQEYDLNYFDEKSYRVDYSEIDEKINMYREVCN